MTMVLRDTVLLGRLSLGAAAFRLAAGGLVLCAFAVCMAPVEARAAADSRVSSISHIVDGTDEKVIITLSRPVPSYTDNLLASRPQANMPCRLYVDLNSTVFAPGVKRRQDVSGASVRVVRAALNDPQTLRVVLELNRELSADDYVIRQNASPASLEIIVKAPPAAPEPRQSPPEQASAGPAPEPPVAQAPPMISAEPSAPPPPAQAAAGKKQPAASGPRACLIAIDAGHGGRDPGAIGHGGLKEKKISLALALELKKVLDSRPGYTTLMTRTGDGFVSLEDRARIATDARADLLISIHGNSHVDAKVDGIETYYLNFSSDGEARRVAARENFTTPEKIGDLEMILFDLSQSDKTNISSLLAGYVHNKLTAAITGRYKTLRNLGVKHAPMRVLIDAEMPGILFEAGFISNPAEARRLQNQQHQQLLATAIADGIHDFFTSSKTAAYRAR
jgi:N-acetylmuramoyl-L-alanine amidase